MNFLSKITFHSKQKVKNALSSLQRANGNVGAGGGVVV
jgi:hypothetical protein